MNNFVYFKGQRCTEFRKRRVALRGVCSCHCNVATQADVLFNKVHRTFSDAAFTFEVRWQMQAAPETTSRWRVAGQQQSYQSKLREDRLPERQRRRTQQLDGHNVFMVFIVKGANRW